jgi:hypothetical protein
LIRASICFVKGILAKKMDCGVKPGNDEKRGSGGASEEPWEEMDDRQSSVEPHHGPVKPPESSGAT